MKFNFLKRKIVFPAVFILAAILVAGGYFYLKSSSSEKYKGKLIQSNEYAGIDKYNVIDTPGGKIIDAPELGLRIPVPSGWQIQIDDSFSPSACMASPEMDSGQIMKSIRENGACVFCVEVYKSIELDNEDTMADYWRLEMMSIEANPEKYSELERPKEGVILIDGKKSLRWDYLREGETRTIEVRTPVNQTVYQFDSGLILNQKCVEEFNKIIDTISISE